MRNPPSHSLFGRDFGGRYAIRVAVVEWLDTTHLHFESLPRCIDVAKCRARVASAGQVWPLAECEPRGVPRFGPIGR